MLIRYCLAKANNGQHPKISENQLSQMKRRRMSCFDTAVPTSLFDMAEKLRIMSHKHQRSEQGSMPDYSEVMGGKHEHLGKGLPIHCRIHQNDIICGHCVLKVASEGSEASNIYRVALLSFPLWCARCIACHVTDGAPDPDCAGIIRGAEGCGLFVRTWAVDARLTWEVEICCKG